MPPTVGVKKLYPVSPLISIRAAVSRGKTWVSPVPRVPIWIWTWTLAERLTAAGLETDQARGLAVTLITVLEGAHVLCRAAGNLEPYEQTARTLSALLGQ